MYFACCSEDPRHAVKHADWRVIVNKPCAHCGGAFKVIRYVKTGTPRDYRGKSASIKLGSRRLTITPVDFTDRQTRGGMKRGREDVGDSKGEPLRKKSKFVEEDDSDSEVSDVEDSEWIGTTEPFKGVYSRLSAIGGYAARNDLDDIAGKRVSRPKIKLKDIGPAVHRGSGQSAAKGGISAVDASGRNLPQTCISGGIGGGTKAVVSEEWCHLWASCLGGATTSDNLVAASYACNTFMMAIETCIKSRTDLSISVSAYCSDAQGNVAEAIRYRIFKKSTGKPLFDRLIDATVQHFSLADLRQLQQDLAEVRRQR